MASNAAAGAGSAGPTNAAASGAAASPDAAAEMPISFQDVPITTAIETLARLAGINYLLDPKIGYGQPDATGLIKPEPTLSLRWDHVTAAHALEALLDNYGLQLVENPKTSIYRITLKDPTAPVLMTTRVIQLKYASTSNMVSEVASVLVDKRSKVMPDPRTSQLVVVATESEQADVDKLLDRLDTPPREVLIETKLIELSSNPSTTKGVDWSGTLQAQNVSFGNGVLQSSSQSTTTIPGAAVTTPAVTSPSGAVITPSTTTTPGSTTTTTLNSLIPGSLFAGGLAANTASGLTPGIGFLSADGLKAVLSFLNQSSEGQVISTPNLVTLDNETATISVTRAFPIMNISAGTANTAGGSSITYSNLGTILLVTPRISANDYIWLKVSPTVSSYFGQDKQTINGVLNTADIFDMRTIDTQVFIPNAHTLVMGGLVKDNPNAQYSKVPILGDIPYLGVAFRSENKSMEKDNLLIFITPTIVQQTDFKPATSHFLDSQPRTMKDPMDMHTWLDSAQPKGEWSNPLSDENGNAQSQNEGKAASAP
jgi:type II secretory pathway component GspD/PulD (secretin)